MNKCCMCGKEAQYEIQLGTTAIGLCGEQICLNALTQKINGGAAPVAWFDLNDLVDHDLINESIIAQYKKDDPLIQVLAQQVSDFIWSDDTFGEQFHEALESARDILEIDYIKKCPDPVLVNIDSLNSDQARRLLEERLKKGT